MDAIKEIEYPFFLIPISPKEISIPFKLDLEFETERFLVKTVKTQTELRQALTLRHDVFFKNLPHKQNLSRMDQDEYDFDSDHLIVIEKKSKKIIGNYRIRSCLFHDRFYSESEFQIQDFLKNKSGSVLEVGRACVDPDFRSGVVIQLLWRGLTSYMKQTGARYLFGCTSISVHIPFLIENVWKIINEKNLLNKEFSVKPIISYDFKEIKNAPFEMPSLLGAYLKAGAQILGAPAYDAEFECADFLTLLDTESLTSNQFNRFFR